MDNGVDEVVVGRVVDLDRCGEGVLDEGFSVFGFRADPSKVADQTWQTYEMLENVFRRLIYVV